MKRIIGPEETMERTDLSRSTLWRMEKKGKFPQRVTVSENRVGWYEEEVNEWIDTRPRVGGNPEPVVQGDQNEI
jgi:prophage regulatory protein